MTTTLRIAVLALVALLAGCAAPQRNVDYAAFRESKPASILVLPPLNTSVDVTATAAVLSQATLPLAESGYYVIPVAVMDETFKQNGLTSADEIHELPATRLREIFGADAALYMTVKQYGSSYAVLSSSITVSIEAALVDLRTGAKLLLLDEISEGLAPVIVQALARMIVSLRTKGYTVVMVEQNFRFAAPLADRLYVMEHGQIVEQFSSGELEGKMPLLNTLLGV